MKWMFLGVLIGLAGQAQANNVNLALNRPTTADSIYSAEFTSSKAVDGLITNDNTGRFSSSSSGASHYLEVDLGNLYNLQKIDLYHGRDASGYYMIDFSIHYKTSSTGAYTQLFNTTGNAVNFTSHPALIQARFIKVISTRNVDNLMRIKEIQVYGDSTPVNGNPTNNPPVVNAGSDRALQLPLNSLTASATASDLDGDILTYNWSKISGGAVTIANPTSLMAQFNGLVQGSYVFRLTANDGKGGITSDDLGVQVNPAAPANHAPIVNAGQDMVITAPNSSLILSASASDADGDSMSFSWSKISGPSASISSATSLSTHVNGLVVGNYQFRFTANDGKGGVTSDDVAVVVNAASGGNPDPNAGIVSLWRRQGTTYPYYWDYDAAVFLPADYGSDPNKKYPMILSLHGLGGTMMNSAHTAVGGNKEGFIKQVWGTSLASTFPAIVIAPDVRPIGYTGNDKWWNWNLTKKVILDALIKYKIDPKRVVVTGLSAGGLGTSELAEFAPELLAGAMPGAFAPEPFNPNPCDLNRIPVWAFGNRSDGTFQPENWEGKLVSAQACSNNANTLKLSVYENSCGHGCWDSHWQQSAVQNWLVNQVKP